MNTKLLTIQHLQINISNSAIIADLSLEVYAGEIITLEGPNGAGKSTALKAIAGQIALGSGQINVTSQPVLVPQRSALFGSLSIVDHLALLGEASMVEEFHKILSSWMQIPDLHRKAETFSGGEQRLIALALAFSRRKEIVLLDEPFAPLKRETASFVSQYLSQYVKLHQRCALVAEHRTEFLRPERTIIFPI